MKQVSLFDISFSLLIKPFKYFKVKSDNSSSLLISFIFLLFKLKKSGSKSLRLGFMQLS